MSMMMPPQAPPDPGMGAPGPPGMGGPPPMDAGGGLPPELMAALQGGGAPGGDPMAQDPTMNSQHMNDEGTDPESPVEDQGDDPVAMISKAISLLREAGAVDTDPTRAHAIDKAQADLQKILATEHTKMGSLRSALGG